MPSSAPTKLASPHQTTNASAGHPLHGRRGPPFWGGGSGQLDMMAAGVPPYRIPVAERTRRQSDSNSTYKCVIEYDNFGRGPNERPILASDPDGHSASRSLPGSRQTSAAPSSGARPYPGRHGGLRLCPEAVPADRSGLSRDADNALEAFLRVPGLHPSPLAAGLQTRRASAIQGDQTVTTHRPP